VLDLEAMTDQVGLAFLRDLMLVLDLLQEGRATGEDDGRQQPHSDGAVQELVRPGTEARLLRRAPGGFGAGREAYSSRDLRIEWR